MPILSLEDWGERPTPPHILESLARQKYLLLKGTPGFIPAAQPDPENKDEQRKPQP